MKFPRRRVMIAIIIVVVVILAAIGTTIAYILMTSPPGGTYSADWDMEPGFPFVGDNVTFNVTLEGGAPPESFFWDFGDGNTSTERSPSHTFNKSGRYWVELQVDWGHHTNASSGSLIPVQNHDIHEVLTGDTITNPSRGGMPYDLIYFDIYDGITRPTVTGRWTGTAYCRELDIFIMTNPTSAGPRLVSEDLGRFFGSFDVTREAEVPEDGAVDQQYIMVLQVIGGTITDYSLELTVEY
jgi:hypothetical protein